MGENSEKRENSEKLRAAHFDEGFARHDRSAFSFLSDLVLVPLSGSQTPPFRLQHFL